MSAGVEGPPVLTPMVSTKAPKLGSASLRNRPLWLRENPRSEAQPATDLLRRAPRRSGSGRGPAALPSASRSVRQRARPSRRSATLSPSLMGILKRTNSRIRKPTSLPVLGKRCSKRRAGLQLEIPDSSTVLEDQLLPGAVGDHQLPIVKENGDERNDEIRRRLDFGSSAVADRRPVAADPPPFARRRSNHPKPADQGERIPTARAPQGSLRERS